MCASETGWARTSPLLRSCGGGPVYPTSSPVDGHQQCTDFDDSSVRVHTDARSSHSLSRESYIASE